MSIRNHKYKLLWTFLAASCITSCTKNVTEVYKPATIIHEQEDSVLGKTEIINTINELIKANIDAYHSYSQAVNSLKGRGFDKFLVELKLDHDTHVTDLSKVVTDLGGMPITSSVYFKGFMLPEYVTIRTSMRPLVALEALETNEIICARYYRNAASLYLPMQIKNVINEHLAHEVTHLQKIDTLKDMFNKR